MPMKERLPLFAVTRLQNISHPLNLPYVLNHKGIVKADTTNRVVAMLYGNWHTISWRRRAGQTLPMC